MIKTSIGQTIKIILVYLTYGLGLGVLASLILILAFKVLPDTIGYTFMIIVPTTCLYMLLRMNLNFNKICIDETSVTLISLFGKKKTYVRENTEFLFSVRGYSVYGAMYAPLLYMKTIDIFSKKHKTYTLARYNENEIYKIVDSIQKTENI